MLEVRSLSKGYGGLLAVESLSFSVEGGEVVALLGPNGAGKSTTLTCVAGYQKPDSGTVLWNGRVLGADRSRHIALVPETPEVFPLLTIWEQKAKVQTADGQFDPARASAAFPNGIGGFARPSDYRGVSELGLI